MRIGAEVFIPAMTMHWVYERFHCVLDLISNILYSLQKIKLINKTTDFKLQLQENRV